MSKILCTFPGKLGDLMWALLTVRAISEQAGEPVDLMLGDYCAPIVELLRVGCPYLDRITANPEWKVEFTAPATPRIPPGIIYGTTEHYEVVYSTHKPPETRGYDKVYHLGYDGWPKGALPYEIRRIAADQGVAGPLALDPWISLGVAATAPNPLVYPPVYLGWTDEWFELKLGLTDILYNELCADFNMKTGSPRWNSAPTPHEPDFTRGLGDWLETARAIASCQLYVGDLSAQWVLANALGIPCVVVEPSEPRHNQIFWWNGPIEEDGRPRNRMVLGGDGKPTFDGRAVVSAVREELERRVRLRRAV